MNDKLKISLPGFMIVLSLVLVLALGIYAWKLNQKVEQLTVQSQETVHKPIKHKQTSAQIPAVQNIAQTPKKPAVKSEPHEWDPWADIATDPLNIDKAFAQMQKRMDEMMDRMQPGRSVFSHHGFGFSTSTPKVNLMESADEYKVVVTMPEGQEVELNTTLENNRLIISGKTKQSSENNSADVYSKSVSSSQFSQSMTLTEPVNESAMTTEKQGDDIIIIIPKAGHS